MPELPDVEVYRKTIETKALNHTLKDFSVKIDKIIKTSSLDEFKHKKLISTQRWGKNCFVEFDNNKWMVMHFGMTGDINHFKDTEPGYSALLLFFDENVNLSYTSKRKLGKIDVCESPESYAKSNDLGPDALSISKKTFLEYFKNKRGYIKSTLMDQTFISGIGNVYSDEILYHARIHPKTKVENLDEKKLVKIYNAMHHVLETAIDAGAEPSNFPDNFIIPQRKKGGKCPCNDDIKKIKVSGRSGYYCPSCQK